MNLADDLNTWLDDRFRYTRRGNRYVIDTVAVKQLAAVVRKELAVLSDDAGMINEHAVEDLLRGFLTREEAQDRAVVGRVAVNLTPVNVAGAVLAVLNSLLWVLKDTPTASPETALMIATNIQAAASAVSVLSATERSLVRLLSAQHQLHPKDSLTAAEITDVAVQAGKGTTEVAPALRSLTTKGAVSWNGQTDGPVTLRKWF